MSKDPQISITRRHLLGASASVAAFSLLPMSALARPASAAAESGLQVWLKRISPAGPVAPAAAPLRWVLRFVGIDSSQSPPLSVGLVYRSCPEQPFELFRGCARPGQGGVSIQAWADALEGLVLRRLDRPQVAVEPCPFGRWLQPSLGVGQYAVLVNSGPRRWRPDWSLVSRDHLGSAAPNELAVAKAWQDWQLLSLDVRPA